MMSRGIGRPVEIVCSRARTVGEVRLQSWSPSGRWARAAKTLAVLWGLAIVSVLVPVAHFLLVPGLLVAGPIVAFRIAHERSMVLGGEGLCPACGKVVSISRCADEWPLTDMCQHCQGFLQIDALQTPNESGA
jgi:hypothetical protein